MSAANSGPDHAHIWGVVSGLGVAAFPARENDRLLDLLADVFPGVRAYPHVVACGLSAGNPILHPAGVLLNAGRVEYARGDFYFYEEGVTPGVVRAIKAVDARAAGNRGAARPGARSGGGDLLAGGVRPARRSLGDDQRQPDAHATARPRLARHPLAHRGHPVRHRDVERPRHAI